MERILLLERLKKLYQEQKEHIKTEQWDIWEKTAKDAGKLHDMLSEDDKEVSHMEKQLIEDIAELYTAVKTELENKIKETGDELDKVDKDLAKLHGSRIKLLEQHTTLSDAIPIGGAVLSVKC